MIYGSWNTRYDRLKFLSFWVIFFPFSPLTTWKIKILTLKKKTPRDIILHNCTINDNHVMYPEIWSVIDNFLSFWTVFCLSTPLSTQKIKILKKWKKTSEDIIILQMCIINDSHMLYCSWDKECNGQNFLSLWKVLKKNKKRPGDIFLQ